MNRSPDAVPLAVLAGLIGLYGWAVVVLAFDHDGLIGPYYNAPGVDDMVYWSAARAAMAGDFGLLADPVALTDQINRQFQGWLTAPLPLHPWLYPPHFLVLLLPFAWLPFALSYPAFQVATFAAAVAAGRLWVGTARRWVVWAVGLALAPALTVNVVSGQNALLTLALMLGGVGLLGSSDVFAGALLGLLSYKPQFAVLVPVALVAGHHWRALAGAAASVVAAVAASVALFGVAPWGAWFGRMLAGGSPGDAAWATAGRLWGLSVWAFATLLGAPGWLANAAQGAAMLAAASGVWLAFRRPLGRDRRMAVLLTATLVAAPHSSPYDLVLLAAVVLLLYRNLLDGTAIGVRPSLLLLPWLAPLATVPRASPLGFGVPLVVVGTFVVLCLPRRDLR